LAAAFTMSAGSTTLSDWSGRGTEAPPHRISAAMFKPVLQTRSDSGGPLMKAFAAALIAAVILYAVDAEYNDARYARVVANAVSNGYR